MPMWTRSWSTLAVSLCEPAHLPVGDRNARGPDEHEADDARDPEPAEGSTSAAPAAERERAKNAAERPRDDPPRPRRRNASAKKPPQTSPPMWPPIEMLPPLVLYANPIARLI